MLLKGKCLATLTKNVLNEKTELKVSKMYIVISFSYNINTSNINHIKASPCNIRRSFVTIYQNVHF